MLTEHAILDEFSLPEWSKNTLSTFIINRNIMKMMPILGIVYMFKYLEGCTIVEEEFDILNYQTDSHFRFSHTPPIHFVDTELFGTEFYGNLNKKIYIFGKPTNKKNSHRYLKNFVKNKALHDVSAPLIAVILSFPICRPI